MISNKGIAIRFLVIVLVCVIVWGEVEVRCIEREREALVSFKNGLIDEYDILTSWRGEECCEWYGVVCSNTTGIVISLQLNAYYNYYGRLRGNVSSSLSELHHLNYLDLSNNDFGGHPIPDFIGSMIQLQHLYLYNSNFSGIVPPQLGNLTHLRSLSLSYNSLSFENLNWLSNLSMLSFLGLSNFDLSHTNWLQHIQSLGSLQELYLRFCGIKDIKPSSGPFVNSPSTSLSILDLSDNHLSSSTFEWLSNVSTSLVKIVLSGNAIGGQIPDAFEKLVHLEFLDVSSNKLEGEIQIPKSLGNLSHLRVLNLYENDLKGNLGELFENLSTTKGMMVSLQILDLAHNQLNGSVPDLRAFTALTELYLDSNKFTGTMPVSLGQLSELRVLNVAYNSLEGLVSESHLMKLHNLKILDLSFNDNLILRIAPDWNPPFQLDYIHLASCNMGPSFPKWIQTQRNLSVLDLSSAGIIDEIPKWLWSLSPPLEELFLFNNQINGTIPDLSSTPILHIDVSSNRISGPIPLLHPNVHGLVLSQNMFFGSIASICKTLHGVLWFLDLSGNQLSGELPNCWENIPYLVYLNLAHNSFVGEIPHSLESLHDLGRLQLRDNNLSGGLPSTLKFCRKLALIDVGGNKLIGEIPAWIGKLNRLYYLNLRSNKLHGDIPRGICNLTQIRILDISINNLSGEIPNCFNNFTALALKNTTPANSRFGFIGRYRYNPQLPNMVVREYNEFSSFQWKGQEAEYRKSLLLLKLIDLSSNRFIGNIPNSFSSMRGLISLNLSRNSFTGNINPDIGQMEMLECLDLSQNQLSGEMPTSFQQLYFLGFLDLSNNNLSGKIPTSTQLQSFDISSYDGNPGLCGRPLTLCPEDSPRPPTQGEVIEDHGFWSHSFIQEFDISMVFGFIVGFWGVVGSFVLKKSWRIAYFNFLDATGDRLYVMAATCLTELRRG